MRRDRLITKRAGWFAAFGMAAAGWSAATAHDLTKAEIAAIVARDAEQAAADPGPEPDWRQFRQLAEAKVRDQLVDPDSAKFEWPYALINGAWDVGIIYSGDRTPTYRAWFTCGLVNSRTSGGGFSGKTAFVAGYKQGAITLVRIDDGDHLDVEHQCNSLKWDGKLGDAPLGRDNGGVAAPATAETVKTALGLELTKVPDGVYVTTVVAGSAAARAGLKPGMVIERLNGLALKGADIGLVDQMLKTASGPVKLSVIGGATFTIGGAAR